MCGPAVPGRHGAATGHHASMGRRYAPSGSPGRITTSAAMTSLSASKDEPEIKSVSVRAVEAVMLDAYPFLGDLPALVPPGVLDGVPEGKRCLAAGQWITRREADTIGDAMGRCVAQGVPVLPVHDALIVPRGAAGIARAALEGAYMAGPGVAVRLKG